MLDDFHEGYTGHDEPPTEEPAPLLQVPIKAGESEAAVVDSCLAALGDANLYDRGGIMVCLSTRTEFASGLYDGSKWKADGSTWEPVREMALREALSTRVVFTKPTPEGGAKPIHCPQWLPAMVLQRPGWPELKQARGLVEWPALVGDCLVTESQYLHTDQVTARIPEWISRVAKKALEEPMTQERAKRACETLLEPFKDFPLADDTARAALLSLILTLVGRYAYPGNVPMFAAIKNQKGAGGSMLINAVSVLVTGCNIAVLQQQTDPDEERKALFAVLLAGDHMALIDNVTAPVGGPRIDSMLTATSVAERVLGMSKKATAPTGTVWCVTGNNVEFCPDTVRRHIPIYLFSSVQSPSERSDITYPGDQLFAHIKKNRGKLLAAAAGILWGWRCAGRPQPKRLMGSFEGWSRTVVGALEWAGYPSPVPELKGANLDSEKGALQTLYANWKLLGATAYRGQTSQLSAGAIIRRLYTEADDSYDGLRELVENLCQSVKQPSAKSLGWALRRLAGQVFLTDDGLTRLVREETSAGVKWRFDSP